MGSESKGSTEEAVRRALWPPVLLTVLLLACGSGGNGAVTDAPRDPRDGSPAGNLDDTSQPDRAWVIFDGDTVVAEVARTPEERERGLMFREELPEGTGMLFVFTDEDIRSFWMQDTYVPLEVAWMNADRRIVDIQQMEPQTTTIHEGAAPAMFALEVPLGWFEARGVTVGDVAEIVFGR